MEIINENIAEYNFEITQVNTQLYSFSFVFIVGSGGGGTLTPETLGACINECEELTEITESTEFSLPIVIDGETTAKTTLWSTIYNYMLDSFSLLFAAIDHNHSGLYEPVIGYTPENTANKAINFNIINDTLFPTVNAVQNQIISLIEGLNWKRSVLYSTTTGENLSLAGLTATIDGVLRTLLPTDRILVKNQTDKKQNGIYNPSATTWARTSDSCTNILLTAATVYVFSGNTEVNRVYSVNSIVDIGVNEVTLALIAGVGTYINGSYLTLTGNIFNVDITALRVNLDLIYAALNHGHTELHDATTQFNQTVASEINGLTAKTTLTNADVFLLEDSETTPTTFLKKRITWANITKAIGTYLETITLTLENKRIIERVLPIVSETNPAINTNIYNCVNITALATDIASMTTNLTGTPTNFQKLIVRIKDDGTSRSIAWGVSYEAMGVSLPTATVAGKLTICGFMYDSVRGKFGLVALNIQP